MTQFDPLEGENVGYDTGKEYPCGTDRDNTSVTFSLRMPQWMRDYVDGVARDPSSTLDSAAKVVKNAIYHEKMKRESGKPYHLEEERARQIAIEVEADRRLNDISHSREQYEKIASQWNKALDPEDREILRMTVRDLMDAYSLSRPSMAARYRELLGR